MRNGFEIIFRDRHEFKHLLAQVRYKNVVIVEIDKEEGNQQMNVTVLCNDPLYIGKDINFSLSDFLKVLNDAKDALAACP